MTAHERRLALLSTIDQHAQDLNEDELLVLANVAEGLATGKREIGDLDLVQDRRDWILEMREEVRDALVYMAADIERLKKLRDMGCAD